MIIPRRTKQKRVNALGANDVEHVQLGEVEAWG